MTGAELVVKLLTEHGVHSVFGYPGGAIMPIYDALFAELGHRPDATYVVYDDEGGGWAGEFGENQKILHGVVSTGLS